MVLTLDDPLIPDRPTKNRDEQVTFDVTSDLEIDVVEFKEDRCPFFLPQPSAGDIVSRTTTYSNYTSKEWFMTNVSRADIVVEKDNIVMPAVYNSNLITLFKKPCVIVVKELFFNNIRYKGMYLKSLESMIRNPVYKSIKAKLLVLKETIAGSTFNIDLRYFLVTKIPINEKEDSYEEFNIRVFVDWKANAFINSEGNDELEEKEIKQLKCYTLRLDYLAPNNEHIDLGMTNQKFKLLPNGYSKERKIRISLYYNDNKIKTFEINKKEKIKLNIWFNLSKRVANINGKSKSLISVKDSYEAIKADIEKLYLHYEKAFSTERLTEIMTDVFKSNFSGNKATQAAIQAEKESISKEKEELARDKELIKVSKEVIETLTPLPDL